MKFTTFNLPEYWASYLINNDASGLSTYEKGQIDNWLKENDLTVDQCADVSSESEFLKHHDATGFALATNCFEFTFYSK